jgi:riboflavin kinase/FMN adenylyltransferase
VETLHDLDELPRGLRFVLVVGMFDGVHRGHQLVLRTAVEAAAAESANALALTFDPHPAAVLGRGAPPLLCDGQEKLERMAELGVDITVVCPFDRRFADQPPHDFLARLAHGRQLRAVVMTPETAFGRGRSGTLAAVEQLAPEIGFHVVHAPELGLGGDRVSSSRIRAALAAGQLAEARRLLGRDYAVIGTVVRGDGRGRQLGYPTANLAFADQVALPPDGIYAVRASWGGRSVTRPAHHADGVASLGVRPTFGGGARTLEAYLFDFDGDLYNQRLRLAFVRRQRGERRFSSVAELIAQMDRDSQRARRILDGFAAKPNAC